MRGVQNAQMQGPSTGASKDGWQIDRPGVSECFGEGTPVSEIR